MMRSVIISLSTVPEQRAVSVPAERFQKNTQAREIAYVGIVYVPTKKNASGIYTCIET